MTAAEGTRLRCQRTWLKLNHVFFLLFAEVERRIDGCILASGIRQKGPHVGGVTKLAMGGE